MGDSHLSLCQICKEPIWNFLCTDCLADGVKSWLPDHFLDAFEKFHQTFSFHFRKSPSEGQAERCIHCKKEREFVMCVFCYSNEVHHWLLRINEQAAKQFADLFDFDFERFGRDEFVRPDQIRPITEMENPRVDFGICDECGEYADELHPVDGMMLCRECAAGD